MTDATRRRTRVETGHTGYLVHQGERLPMRTRNLSLKGLLCELDAEPRAALVPGASCQVEFPLSPDVQATLEGMIMRLEHERHAILLVAVDFTGMDPDSYAHLRNLVRFSAPDADAIDQEELHTPFAP